MSLDFIEDIRDYLKNEEISNYRKLPSIFKTNPNFDQNLLENSEFFNILTNFNINLKEEEKNIIKKNFSEKNKINTKKFLRYLTGIPNKRRQVFIDKAFLKFDEDGRGEILIQDIKTTFNFQIHPLYQNGFLSKENVICDFLECFPFWENGVLFREDWNEYFAVVSSFIKNDDHFVQLMKTTWRLD